MAGWRHEDSRENGGSDNRQEERRRGEQAASELASDHRDPARRGQEQELRRVALEVPRDHHARTENADAEHDEHEDGDHLVGEEARVRLAEELLRDGHAKGVR